MSETPLPSLHVPARDILIPSHLSPQAAGQLAMGTVSSPIYPPLDDIEAWRQMQREADEGGLVGLRMLSQHIEAEVEEIDADGVRVYQVTPTGVSPDDPSVYFDIHGGALVQGGGEFCKELAKIMARMMGARVWSVDYRLPPDHRYPAPLDDCVTAYRALLRQSRAENIIVGGASAGGNLAAATILRARDEGLAMPVAAVILTPQIDLTECGDSFRTLLGVDTALTGSLMPANLMYAGGHDLSHPYLSPLFGDFTKGFPPTILQSGTRDLFLSNTVLMHRALRRADIEAELHIFDAATHVMFMAGPEAEDRSREIRKFVDCHWQRGG